MNWPPNRIKAVLEYSAKATPGPWKAAFPTGRDTQWLDIVVGANDEEILHAETEPLPHVVWHAEREKVAAQIAQHKGNLEFCANARTDLPDAMRELQKMRVEFNFKMGPSGPLEALWQLAERATRGMVDFKDGEKGGLTDLGALRLCLRVTRSVLDAAREDAK